MFFFLGGGGGVGGGGGGAGVGGGGGGVGGARAQGVVLAFGALNLTFGPTGIGISRICIHVVLL